MSTAHVVSLSVTLRDIDTFHSDTDLLEHVIACAERDIHRQINAVKDTSNLDWDQIDSDELINRYQEYTRLRRLQDVTADLGEWIRGIPPF